MEEKKTKNEEKPQAISDEQIKVYYDELMQRYRAAVKHIEELEAALSDRSFEMTSFTLNSLFRVMEHPNRYEDKFVNWVSKNIQGYITSLIESMTRKPEEGNKQAGNEA